MIEKLSEYKDLETEISRMWDLKPETVPLVIGALALVKKGLGKYEKIPGNINIEELQKISLFGHSQNFPKSAVYQLNNDSPQPLLRKLVAFWSPGQYKL